MKSCRIIIPLSLALLATPFLAQAQQRLPDNAQGLAVGQNPKLLLQTRTSDAGAGNGGEFGKKKCSYNFGAGAHDMASAFVCSAPEFDPGNSQEHNQSPECEILNCSFGPANGH